MAKYRNIHVSFWTDRKISEEFTAEERFLFLYLLTNPLTNMCGCYEIGYKAMSDDTGLTVAKVKQVVKSLMDHKVISYNETTGEVLLVNWYRYNWTDSDKIKRLIASEVETIKTKQYRDYLNEKLNGKDTLSIGYRYPIKNTFSLYVSDSVTDTVIDSNTVKDTDSGSSEDIEKPKYPYKEICDRLNEFAGTGFRDKSKDTRKLIKARFDDGYTLDDFFTVIEKKCAEWKGTDMEKYLRPSTLFGSKFESYLNQCDKPSRETVKGQREYYESDWTELL